MKIAVVILNWNGRALLEAYLPSVVTHSQDMARVYLADNASTDDSVAFCKSRFRESVTVIQNAQNGGYARGYNQALKNIKADIFVLLNSDVAVTPGWLTPVIAAFEAHPDIAAAQPKIKDVKRKDYFEYAGAAGGFLDGLGYPYCRGRIFDRCEKDTGQYDNTIDIQWASGACLFVRSQVFWEVGGLDEDFFAHQEEIDLCWRIKNKGHRIIACGSSEVFHLGGATLAAAHPKKTFYNFRNSLFALVKNVSSPRVFLCLFLRLVLDGVAGLKFLTEGKPSHFMAIIKAHFSSYGYFLKMWHKRAQQLSSAGSYYTVNSIVVAYFIRQKKNFRDLK